jgi:hypothetical protein
VVITALTQLLARNAGCSPAVKIRRWTEFPATHTPADREILMKTALTGPLLLVLAIVCGGCKPAADETADANANSDAPIIMDELPPIMDDSTGHPDHGPHGGELVELGKEDFHAELIHGDGGVSLYVLDGSATETVAIAAEKLVVSLKRFGKVASFDLAANPDANDPAGKISRFSSADPKLHAWLDADAEGVVTVQIEGKSYTGRIAHDHAGH